MAKSKVQQEFEEEVEQANLLEDILGRIEAKQDAIVKYLLKQADRK